MKNPNNKNITELFEKLSNSKNKEEIYQQIFPLVYRELMQIAKNIRFRWQGDLTLNTTSLVHETYLINV